MVRLPSEMVLPVPLIPESISVHLRSVTAERGVCQRFPLQVHVPQLCQIRPGNLVGIDIDDLVYVEREKNVQEEDLVRPDQTLLLSLLV